MARLSLQTIDYGSTGSQGVDKEKDGKIVTDIHL
jgi:hypothetical protein